MRLALLFRRPCRSPGLVLALVAVLVGSGLPAQAEKADSEQALTFDAGRMVLDGKRKIRTLSGGVEITRGTLVLKAAQIELRETAQGQFATATGADGQPATFRQKREGLEEIVEGQARRIEYDTVTETVRFIDQAQVRVLRAGAVRCSTVRREPAWGTTVMMPPATSQPPAAGPA